MFLLVITCLGICYVFPLGIRCSGMCVLPCCNMLRDMCFFLLLHAEGYAMYSLSVLDARGCVFSLGISCSGMCVSSRYYMLRDMCSLLVLDDRGCVFTLSITCSGKCVSP